MLSILQNTVNKYRALAVVVKNKDSIYESEVFYRGVKFYVGRDSDLFLSLAKAFVPIIDLIGKGRIDQHTEHTAEGLTSFLDCLEEDKETIFAIIVSKEVKTLLP